MEPRDHVENATRAAEAARHRGPRTRPEKIAAVEVLVIAAFIALVTLAIQAYDSTARNAAYRVSDSYAEAIVSAQPSPTPSPNPFNKLAIQGGYDPFFPTKNVDLLTAREARIVRDAYETLISALQIWAAALQIGVVLASVSILIRRYARWLLWIAAIVSVAGIAPVAHLVLLTDWGANLP